MIAALSLGWELSDLFARARRGTESATPPAELAAIDALSPRERTEIATAKVSSLIAMTLGGDLELPTVDALRAAADGDDVTWRQAAHQLHVRLLTRLEARDATLAGAYDLGRSLAETSRDPKDLGSLLDRLDPARILPIEARLADLSSRLPRHSAAAVAATLEQWMAWTSEARARESMDGVRGALSRQRALWRSLLTGEKRGRQMLDPDTLVAASVRHASRLGTLIRGLTGAYLPALIALIVSVVLVLWTILIQAGIATVIAALGALAATMLTIRKSLELTAQDTIDELRADLWASELDAAVAQSILRLPPAPAAAKRPKLSLAKAPSDAPASEPRTSITQRLEKALHVTTSARKQGLRVSASGPATAAPDTEETEASSNGHVSDS